MIFKQSKRKQCPLTGHAMDGHKDIPSCCVSLVSLHRPSSCPTLCLVRFSIYLILQINLVGRDSDRD